MVTVTLEDSSKIYKPYVSGEGLVSDSSNVIIVGLGMQKATNISVSFIGRSPIELSGTFRNTLIDMAKSM